ncbi:AMP-dependent synthetase and ligase [Pirellula staleyi DSM 6068]|uniref:AMP-dependent synthetase and ligase n=1 Tax=Pirellula staleyi (strain ATCC 27377 / DSM 6068 / ICPB 4128) TaxID=530564 RepID=D2R3S3_PIRSD|nr:AMP-binding protein [Pirellula staleyi]ADB17027.1 AMP-dependent synthetase and ligase [Pirellula staleyi DSM 6068]
MNTHSSPPSKNGSLCFHRATELAVDRQTIGQVLAQTAAKFSDRDAMVFLDPAHGLARSRWTWHELAADVRAVTRGLIACGIRTGDHVAIWATNIPQWVLLQLATAEIGAVLVTINPAYRPFELEYVLGQSDAAALFLSDAFKTSNYYQMFAEVCPELGKNSDGVIQSIRFPKLRLAVGLRGAVPSGMLRWQELVDAGKNISDAELAPHLARPQPEDAVNIQYTSGTTGFPKAAMLSHRNLLMNALYIGDRQHLTAADRICIPVPFYHCFGCVLGSLAAVVHGAAMILPAEHFQATKALVAIEQERATALYGVPTMFIAMLEDPTLAARDISSLRTGIMAGSPCPIEVMRRVTTTLHCPELTIAYGQTEASPVITQTSIDDPLELRVETVGRPLPGFEVRIVGPDNLDVPEGEQGELVARGHGVMIGYYANPQATAAAIDREGWLHSGDLARRLPTGHYKITGRLKEMVIRGGENIYPREIEEFLFTHPAIEQVAVVGVPDSHFGEELCAWIKRKADAQLTEDDVRAYCRGSIAHYKTPRYICLVDSFPQTVTGKIQKFKIRETMIDQLGLEEEKTA